MPTIRLLGFHCLRKAYLVGGEHSHVRPCAESETKREPRGLLQLLMVYQAIAIDGAVPLAMPKAPLALNLASNAHGGAGASTDRVVVPI